MSVRQLKSLLFYFHHLPISNFHLFYGCIFPFKMNMKNEKGNAMTYQGELYEPYLEKEQIKCYKTANPHLYSFQDLSAVSRD